MPVDHRAKLIFVHIPKTAGTSIEQALGLNGDWRYETRDTLFGRVTDPCLLSRGLSTNFLQHLRLKEIQSCFDCSDYEIFTVVRDPWTRFLSSFRRKDPDLCSYINWRVGFDLSDFSLSEYLGIARWAKHPHFNSQVSFLKSLDRSISLQDGLRGLNIFRFEKLEVLEAWLSDKYNSHVKFERHQKPEIPLPNISVYERLQLQEQVFELYRHDYRAFGYTIN